MARTCPLPAIIVTVSFTQQSRFIKQTIAHDASEVSSTMGWDIVMREKSGESY